MEVRSLFVFFACCFFVVVVVCVCVSVLFYLHFFSMFLAATNVVKGTLVAE